MRPVFFQTFLFLSISFFMQSCVFTSGEAPQSSSSSLSSSSQDFSSSLLSSSSRSSSSQQNMSSNGNSSSADDYAIRVPQEFYIECPGSFYSPIDTVLNRDFICSYSEEGIEKTSYVQFKPTSCTVVMSNQINFTGEQGWTLESSMYTNLDSLAYDWGGNHGNDAFTIHQGNHHLRFYHSSFSVGWRACQPVDCYQVLDEQGIVIDDGCTTDRTHPAICKPILEDGSHEELIDTFEKCYGDDS